MLTRVVVVGASLAGFSAARALRGQGYDGEITLVGAERHRPYDRPPLSKSFLAGHIPAAELALASGQEEADLALQWQLGRRAVGLDPVEGAVVLDTGQRLLADGVVVATGARARTLPGPSPAGVHTLRTLDDAEALRADLVDAERVVVVGAGFVGAEVAATLHGLGRQVTLVEALRAPLAGPLGEEMGAVCARMHADHGVRLLTGVGVDGFVTARTGGGERVTGVRLGTGEQLAADLVVVGVGAVPNVEWLAGSGLVLSGGVVTDVRCATNLESVVATGDCAASYHPCADGPLRLEHWTNALEQPAAAAATLLGAPDPRPPRSLVPYFWSDQYGSTVQFAGVGRVGDRVEVVEGDPDQGGFVAVYRRGERLVAVLARDQPQSFGRWRRDLVGTVTGRTDPRPHDPEGAPR
ncbi:MAG: NAD(P)/FAD-dependent oxidoreductase [Actinomycetes bacterium]